MQYTPTRLGTSFAGTLQVLLVLTGIAAAAPSITFPINSQVPPVARTAQQYQFTFSSTTFNSSSPPVQYSLTNSPSWLELDGPSRTFSGNPGTQDVGSVSFSLIATDMTGSISMGVTLIVSSDPGPGIGTPVAQQLTAISTFSSPNIVLLYPSAPLAVSLSSSTFTNTNGETVYYALCANNTPLPSWVNFDPDTLSFSGTAPGSTSPAELPQDYNIELTASDVPGFAGAVAVFQIIVGNHELTFGNATPTIQVTPGFPFSYNDLEKQLLLDRNPIQSTDIRQSSANTPTWMSFDNSTMKLSGTTPNDVRSQNVTVYATDLYGDSASTTIYIEVNGTSNLIQGIIGNINATIGTNFSFAISPALLVAPDLQVTINLGNASSWLKYDAPSMTLYGQVPGDFASQQDNLSLSVSQGSQSQSQNFTLTLLDGGQGTGAGTGRTSGLIPNPSSASGTMHPTSQTNPLEANGNTNSREQLVAAAIALPLVVLVAILLLICYCARRKRRQQAKDKASEETTRQISRPTAPDEQSGADDKLFIVDEKRHTRMPSKPPKIDIMGFRHSRINLRNSQSRFSWKTFDEEEEDLEPRNRPSSQARKRDSIRDLIQRWTVSRPGSAVPPFSVVEDEMSLKGHGGAQQSRMRPASRSRFSTVAQEAARERKHISGMSLMSRGGSVMNGRISGIGHGSGIVPSSPSKGRRSRQFNRQSGMSIFSGMGHGRETPKRPRNGPAGFASQDSTSESYSSWTNTTDDRTISSLSASQNLRSTIGSFPYPPATSSLTRTNTIPEDHAQDQNQDSTNSLVLRPTIRLVTSPSSSRTDQDVSTARKEYLKRRRRHPQRESPLFSAGPSTSRKSSQLSHHKTNLISSTRLSEECNESSWEDEYSQSPSSDWREGKEKGGLETITNVPPCDPPRATLRQRSYSASSSLQPLPTPLKRQPAISSLRGTPVSVPTINAPIPPRFIAQQASMSNEVAYPDQNTMPTPSSIYTPQSPANPPYQTTKAYTPTRSLGPVSHPHSRYRPRNRILTLRPISPTRSRSSWSSLSSKNENERFESAVESEGEYGSDPGDRAGDEQTERSGIHAPEIDEQAESRWSRPNTAPTHIPTGYPNPLGMHRIDESIAQHPNPNSDPGATTTATATAPVAAISDASPSTNLAHPSAQLRTIQAGQGKIISVENELEERLGKKGKGKGREKRDVSSRGDLAFV